MPRLLGVVGWHLSGIFPVFCAPRKQAWPELTEHDSAVQENSPSCFHSGELSPVRQPTQTPLGLQTGPVSCRKYQDLRTRLILDKCLVNAQCRQGSEFDVVSDIWLSRFPIPRTKLCHTHACGSRRPILAPNPSRQHPPDSWKPWTRAAQVEAGCWPSSQRQRPTAGQSLHNSTGLGAEAHAPCLKQH